MATTGDGSALEALRRERNRFVAFAFAISDLVVEIEPEGRVIYAAGATLDLLGVLASRLEGQNLYQFITPDDRKAVKQAIDAVVAGTRSMPIHARLLGSDGRFRTSWLHVYKLPQGGANAFVAFTRASASATTIRPETAAARDPVSGALKKDEFSNAVTRRIAQARSEARELKLTLFGMASVGDENGESETEQHLMAEVAALLRSHAEGPDDVGRIGDGKFGVVHDASVDLVSVGKEIETLAQRLQDGAAPIAVHASVVALDGTTSEHEWAKAVLFTLNKFSETSPGDFSLTSLADSAKTMLQETLEWTARIRRTIGERLFMLAFQPIVTITRRKIHHFEALLRLPAEPGITPYKFVTMAEQLGSIADLDLTVASQVIELLRGKAEWPEAIAVNVSGRSLVTAGFVDALTDLIRRNADIAPRLLVEVTESSKIPDLKGVNQALQELKKYNVRVCLDDFGAGAAAFEYLRSLQVDILKIDGSFIKNAAAAPFDRAFIRSIASLCEGLGITTIAEMVEDEETASVVRACGIPLGQGYLFGRPAPMPGMDEAPRPRLERAHWDPIAGRRMGA
jgi:PAS domain S-box-containing protein